MLAKHISDKMGSCSIACKQGHVVWHLDFGGVLNGGTEKEGGGGLKRQDGPARGMVPRRTSSQAKCPCDPLHMLCYETVLSLNSLFYTSEFCKPKIFCTSIG